MPSVVKFLRRSRNAVTASSARWRQFCAADYSRISRAKMWPRTFRFKNWGYIKALLLWRERRSVARNLSRPKRRLWRGFAEVIDFLYASSYQLWRPTGAVG